MSQIVEQDRELMKSDVDELLGSFFGGKSEQTIEAYRSDLNNFASFLNVDEINDVAHMLLSSSAGKANSIVLRYKNWLLDAGFSPNTVNRKLASIRSLVKLAKMMGIVVYDIVIPNQKSLVLKDVRGHQNHEVTKILKNLSKFKSSKNIRDIAIVRLLHDLALRASEITSINIEDYSPQNGTLLILGKGMREKVLLSLPKLTNEAVLSWVNIRDSKQNALFYNLNRSRDRRQRLTRQGLRKLVMKLAADAGVQVKTTHSWRHASITQALIKAQEKGYGLEVVLDHSRHSKNSINLLMTYRDRFQDVQGEIANMVACQLGVQEEEK
jgi:integrase/recombinase XerC